MRTENRLKRLEAKPPNRWAKIRRYIRDGFFYDQLSEHDKTEFCRYMDADKNALEDCENHVCGSLHFRLQEKPIPPKPSDLTKIINEVETKIESEV